ncbi:hypothetical protein DSL64_06490 [Dyadobacter luteus]|jgi:hypothetical protein|uniref:Uncharacterized protein n=1 Tax=Dyadobacter luteus TaxID=2259619 RepID=A0A3D8YF50_9BACT|nr:hypothetical protein DSL64_06490 [Dyadobacter luteus]
MIISLEVTRKNVEPNSNNYGTVIFEFPFILALSCFGNDGRSRSVGNLGDTPVVSKEAIQQ